MVDRAETNRVLRILLIGALPPPIGGTTILLKDLVDLLRACPDIELCIVNTARRSPGLWGAIECAVRTSWRVFQSVWRVDVVTFHVSESPKILHLWFLARLARKPILRRWFGGTNYREYGSALSRSVAKWMICHADVNLFETKTLVQMSREDGARRVYWFPNTRRFRQIEPEHGNRPRSCRRFIFVGRVSEVKGIREILDVDEHLPDSVSIMVFGPFTGKISQKDFEGRKRVHYGGVLQPEEVPLTLRQYDALLLPTYFPREGYPGVIIEAYGVGMPVICSRWQAIPEIVDETSGILIPPRNSCALLEAIQTLAQDEEWYARLRAGARNRREEFASEQWAGRFVEYCQGLLQRER